MNNADPIVCTSAVSNQNFRSHFSVPNFQVATTTSVTGSHYSNMVTSHWSPIGCYDDYPTSSHFHQIGLGSENPANGSSSASHSTNCRGTPHQPNASTWHWKSDFLANCSSVDYSRFFADYKPGFFNLQNRSMGYKNTSANQTWLSSGQYADNSNLCSPVAEFSANSLAGHLSTAITNCATPHRNSSLPVCSAHRTNTFTSATSASCDYSKSSHSATVMVAQQPSKKRSGGRKPREEETQLPPEEEEKRRLRRLRNKEAAARCRKRRLDQMSTLELKVNELCEQQQSMEDELEQLMQEKEHLEFVLRVHQPSCRMISTPDYSKANSVDRDTVSADSTDSMQMASDHRLIKSKSLDPTLTSVQVSLPDVASNENFASSTIGCSQGMPNDTCGLGLSRPSTLPLSLAVGRVLFPSPFNLSSNDVNAANSTLDSLGNSQAQKTSLRRSFCLGSSGDPGSLGLGSIPIQTPSKIGDFDPLNAPTGFTPLIAQVSSMGGSFLSSHFSAVSSSQSQTTASLETPVVGESKTILSGGSQNFAKL